MAKITSLAQLREMKDEVYFDYGVATNPRVGFFTPFHSRYDFGRSIAAPVVMPVVSLFTALHDALRLVLDVGKIGLKLAMLNFPRAKAHAIHAVNHLLGAVYSIFSVIYDTLCAATMLVTRSLATMGAPVQDLVSAAASKLMKRGPVKGATVAATEPAATESAAVAEPVAVAKSDADDLFGDAEDHSHTATA